MVHVTDEERERMAAEARALREEGRHPPEAPTPPSPPPTSGKGYAQGCGYVALIAVMGTVLVAGLNYFAGYWTDGGTSPNPSATPAQPDISALDPDGVLDRFFAARDHLWSAGTAADQSRGDLPEIAQARQAAAREAERAEAAALVTVLNATPRLLDLSAAAVRESGYTQAPTTCRYYRNALTRLGELAQRYGSNRQSWIRSDLNAKGEALMWLREARTTARNCANALLREGPRR